MSEDFRSDYKNTDEVRRYLKRYNSYNIMHAIGIFVLVMSIVPYLLIQSDKLENRIVPSLITLVIGIIMIFLSRYLIGKLKEKSMQKYTIKARDYIDHHHKSNAKLFRRDLVIGILLIILLPILYWLITYKAAFIPTNTHRYINAVLVSILAIALFIIFISKGRKDAKNIFDEVNIY